MSRILAGLGWLVFAGIVVLGGQMMLGACEVGTWPLLGYAYCPVPPRQDRDASDFERQRTRVLQSRIRRAELQLAALPVCQPPPPPMPPEPEKRAEAPPPPQPDQMKMPATLAELKGCWVSERGDLPLVSDDEEQRPMGKVRECYCFGDEGQGQLTLAYTDGIVCRGKISAKLQPSNLTIRLPSFDCGIRRGMLRGKAKGIMTCRPDKDGIVSCRTQTLGRMRYLTGGVSYQRIDGSQCGVQG